MQIHHPEHQIRGHSDDNHFEHFAANIVGDLLIHLHPNLSGQPAIAGQNATHGTQHLLFIFEQKEHHHRHQNQINCQRQ
ncbi:hypothetical protein SRABI106_03572 [Rahnella aquatilis]|nr:hypothetical protein SRABI106_03572 [Rahnella aquatilis]